MKVFELWVPILASGLATHVWSTLAWMVLPHHKPEWTKFPAEDELQDLLVSKSIPTGQYIIPHAASGAEFASEEFQRKLRKGRSMFVVWPAGPMNMGKAIVCTLLFFFVAAFMIAYLASLALAPGASFGQVFQFVGTAGLMTYCAAHFPHVFWFKRKIAMELLDGVVMAVLTALIFASLWPAGGV